MTKTNQPLANPQIKRKKRNAHNSRYTRRSYSWSPWSNKRYKWDHPKSSQRKRNERQSDRQQLLDYGANQHDSTLKLQNLENKLVIKDSKFIRNRQEQSKGNGESRRGRLPHRRRWRWRWLASGRRCSPWSADLSCRTKKEKKQKTSSFEEKERLRKDEIPLAVLPMSENSPGPFMAADEKRRSSATDVKRQTLLAW